MFSINSFTERMSQSNQKPVMQKLKKYAVQMGPQVQDIFENIQQTVYGNTLGQVKFSALKFKTVLTESNVCARILQKRTKGIYLKLQKAFKCHDCVFQNNSIMCVQCFEDSDHKGHIYEVVEVFGGCCDCGDEEKWNPVGFCKKHSNKNLVQEIQQKVDKKQQERFIKQLGFCFLYYFVLYDEAERQFKKGSSQEFKGQAKAKLDKASQFGAQLIDYLSEFNKNSLISNIMTFNLLRSCIPLKELDLSFCPQAENKSVLQIIFHVLKVEKCPQLTVNLFTQLFPLKEFRRQLTITFMRLHHESTRFAMSEYNHLTCQLLTSHKMISQLVESKQIKPLTYKPKQNEVKSFEEMARNLMRHFIDIDYLSRLYKDTSEKYLCYHILQGQITSIGYYKIFSYLYQQSITYYGAEQVGLSKLTAIMSVIKNSPQCIKVLQKGMTDLWRECQRLYKLWNKQLFSNQTYQSASLRNIFITYQMQFSLVVFMYFQKLAEINNSNLQDINQQQQQQQRISQVVTLLKQINNQDNNNNKTLQQQILQMLEVVNNNLILCGLTLGHPQTMERYYSFYAFTFKKSHMMISCTLYLIKLLTKMLNYVRKQHQYQKKSLQKQSKQQQSKQKQKQQYKINICDQAIFKRPFNLIENLFDLGEFDDDDQSIFDRKKNLLRVTHYLHLLIQASQTDIYQLIIASNLGLLSKQKYQKMLNKLYLNLLSLYNKSSIKDFKKVADSFIHNDQAFQKFISSSKQILIEHGKISLKNIKEQPKTQTQSKSKQQKIKVQSQINLFYFKTFKSKLTNLSDKQIVFKTPQSQNHFLTQILSEQFVSKLMKLLIAYIDMMVMENGKVKAEQSGTLGLLVIQMIKIGKAFQHKSNSKIPDLIFDYFRNLQHKKVSLSIFPQEIVKIICSESQQSNNKFNATMNSLDKQAQFKASQRKRKLQEKKKKMVAKFKQNQEKFQETYGNQLRKIRDEMEEQNQMQTVQQQSQQNKVCIICRENQQKQKFMIMCFMQLSDLYDQMIKGKQEKSTNCHLVFKTCGHYIHESCYKKTNKNEFQEYSICHLCKSTVNCLFPICVSQKLNSKQQESVQQKKRKESLQFNQEKKDEQLYEQLKISFNYLFVMDSSLREDCENGFSQPLVDCSEIKYKLLQSFVSEIVFSAVICKQANQKLFYSKQIEIYRNILYAIKIFDQRELKEYEQLMCNKPLLLKEQIPKIIKQKQKQIQNRTQKQSKQQRKTSIQISYQMEIYVLNWIYKFLQHGQSKTQLKTNILSSECVEAIQYVLNKIVTGDDKMLNKKQEIQIIQIPQVKLLNSQLIFFNPPQSLQKLIKMRGKCPNCQKFTNLIQICLICEWRGCKGCQIESVLYHTRNHHCGNSIYLDADVGNIYFVSKKKFWAYGSIYQDYLGESFKVYAQGVKLQKYTLNEHRYDKLKKALLSYAVESTIRYEEYSKKRQFVGNI